MRNIGAPSASLDYLDYYSYICIVMKDMKDQEKYTYEAPTVTVVEVKFESGILFESDPKVGM